jgi:hypothetical protein
MHTDLNQPQALARALRSLPAAPAECYAFEEFERRALRHHQAHRRRAAGAAAALLAVVMLIGVALSVRWHAAPMVAQRPPLSGAGTPQAWTSGPSHEPALVHVGTHAAVLGLEDRIAQVDDLLSAAGAARAPPAGLAALQQERNRLAGALVQVRYAENLVDASQ